MLEPDFNTIFVTLETSLSIIVTNKDALIEGTFPGLQANYINYR